MIGKSVSHYRIVDKLDVGGMAVVYKAEDLELGRPAALKFLPGALSDDEEAKERFLREAKAASSLDHPNICKIYEIGETDEGRLYIAMACYEGETLLRKISRGPLPLADAVGYVRQTAAGLARSHELDIIHRDIKPANIFITVEGQVKILDFGLAKVLGEGVTLTGLARGTPAYMAPERIRNERANPKTDLWSLGVVLYEALTGRRPFEGANVAEIIQAVRRRNPRDVRLLRPEVPVRLSAVVRRLLSKSPRSRYRDCRQLLGDLEALAPAGVDSEPPAALFDIESPASARGRRPPARNPDRDDSSMRKTIGNWLKTRLGRTAVGRRRRETSSGTRPDLTPVTRSEATPVARSRPAGERDETPGVSAVVDRLTTSTFSTIGPVDDTDDTISLLVRHGGALERYSDSGEVGRGGMGRVHRVLDKSLLREVALKILRPELESQERQVQRFMREAQITSQLDHPNIVPIHEVGRDPDTGYYISMKLVHGRTLTEAIEEAGEDRLEPDRLVEFLQIFIKVCEAVGFAHSRGVIHRDLKPSNIMVGEFGQVYLMDWGVARLLPIKGERPARYAAVASSLEGSLEEQAGNIIGTPRYMPPEQIQGLHDEVDERSDIFALGATLYHVLTGQPPYTAQSYYNTLLEALAGKVRPPGEVVGKSRIPPGLEQIAMKAMAPKPEDRYPSSVALQKDVERFLRGSWDQVIETFAAGARIVTEGEEGDVAYIILEGHCLVFTMAGGKKVVLRELGPGEVFAETAVFSSAVRTASVEAIDDVTLKVVSRETLTHGLGLNSWMGTFVKALAERFRDVDERLRRLELETALNETED